MSDITRVASDHKRHSTAADYDLNAEFTAEMRQARDDIAAAVVRLLEADEQRELMTMAEVLAGRAAAGMCDVDKMRRTMQDAHDKHRYTWRGCAGNSADEYDSGSEGHW